MLLISETAVEFIGTIAVTGVTVIAVIWAAMVVCCGLGAAGPMGIVPDRINMAKSSTVNINSSSFLMIQAPYGMDRALPMIKLGAAGGGEALRPGPRGRVRYL